MYYFVNAVCAHAQDSALQQLPDKYFSQVSSKSRRFEKQVSKRLEKALNKLARQEKKTQARLAKIDPVAARNIFTRSLDSLGNLQKHSQPAGLFNLSAAGNTAQDLEGLQNRAQAEQLIQQQLTGDIAAQVTCQFHKNGSAGIGAASKLGLDTGLNDIRFSHQGVGLRSFLGWKLKGTFYINGDFEQNYNSQLLKEEQLRNFDNWQGSALIGISNKYKVSSKLKGNIILLYDFLHNQHVRDRPYKVAAGV